MIYKIVTLLFLILSLILSLIVIKKKETKTNLIMLFLLNYCACRYSNISINIVFLFIMIFIQVLTFAISIIISKAFMEEKKYYITLFIISICAILSITCSYGYYYSNINLIKKESIWNFNIHFTIISNILNGILTRLYLFITSLKYYFLFSDDFVQETQFIIGLLIDSIILGSLYSIIRNFLKYNKQKEE